MIPARPDAICHPGLLLDKWHDEWCGDKSFARDQLKRVTMAGADDALLGRLRSRFAELTPDCVRWISRTSGPLTLHLSRAGSFENAGICLHPIYGFAYLPGTGLKGMARAYARNAAHAATAEIEEVFGKDVTRDEDGAAGAVVFYDALPVQWPKLIVDIVNNHHSKYYNGEAAPEDWENPVPVNFLAVLPGTEFEFCLGVRRGVVESKRVLALAKQWIDGALAWLGAGAKTNAGYGRFATSGPSHASVNRSTFKAKISFVSPGFLAGAQQSKDDCTLRPATLRGLLRSWWRTLHAGFLPLDELRQIEGEIWGTTISDAAIALHLEPAGTPTIQQFNFQKPREMEAIPGRFYLAYGMEGNPTRKTPARWFVQSGASWLVTLVARDIQRWRSQAVLDQAVLSLWLLSEFGGIGAKARRGFGSFDLSEPSEPLPTTKDVLTRAANIRPTVRFEESRAESPSLSRMAFRTLPLKSPDPWSAIDRLGESYRSFTASEKRKPEKVSLGLPRAIGRRNLDQKPLRHPAGNNYSRHASPLHLRLVNGADGYGVRITTLPSPHLPDLQQCRDYLKRCSDFMAQQLLGQK